MPFTRNSGAKPRASTNTAVAVTARIATVEISRSAAAAAVFGQRVQAHGQYGEGDLEGRDEEGGHAQRQGHAAASGQCETQHDRQDEEDGRRNPPGMVLECHEQDGDHGTAQRDARVEQHGAAALPPQRARGHRHPQPSRKAYGDAILQRASQAGTG
jgi:hypothetical protein